LANYQGAGGRPARRAIFRAGGQPARRVNISELAGNQLVGQNFDYTNKVGNAVKIFLKRVVNSTKFQLSMQEKFNYKLFFLESFIFCY